MQIREICYDKKVHYGTHWKSLSASLKLTLAHMSFSDNFEMLGSLYQNEEKIIFK